MRYFAVTIFCVLALGGCRTASHPGLITASSFLEEETPLLDSLDAQQTRIQKFLDGHAQWSEDDKITYLMRAIQTSPETFFRNGSTFSGAQAMRWVRRKLLKRHYDHPIQTARHFIDYVSSYSRTTGKSYLMAAPDGRWVPVKQVLDKELWALEQALQKRDVWDTLIENKVLPQSQSQDVLTATELLVPASLPASS